MKNFDKLFRNKVSETEMPVADGIWESIESQIVHQKETSRLWLFFLLPIICLPAMLMVYQGNKASDRNVLVENLADLGAPALDHSSTEVPGRSVEHLLAELSIPPSPAASREKAPLDETQYGLPEESSVRTRQNTGMIYAATTGRDEEKLHTRVPGVSPAASIGTPGEIAGIKPGSTHGLYSKASENQVALLNGQTGSECPSFKVYYPGFYLYGQYTAATPFQKLTPRNAEFSEYTEKRKLTESPAYSYSATLGVGYQFGNGLFAESGLSYDKINMTFDFVDENAVQNSTVITIDTMIINDRDTIISADTIVVNNTGKNDVLATNTFRQFDLPIVLGYEFPLGEKIRMSVKGGVHINITSSNQGYMIGLDDRPLAYGSASQSDNAYFKKNIGFSYSGGMNFEADISPDISLYAGVNYRYYPNNFSLNTNPVNQSYSKLGLTTGIKYRL